MNSATAIKILFSEEHLSASAIGKYLRCPRSYGESGVMCIWTGTTR